MSPRPAPAIVHFDHPDGERKLRIGACRKDKHDPSHSHYQANQFAPDELPKFVDLRPHLTEVEDQGDLGSCTANALAGAVEYLEKRLNDNPERVSRLFLYWNERDFEQAADKDAGAALSDGIKSLKEDGICSEDVWPYDVDNVFDQPHDEAYDAASDHTIDEAHRVKIELHDLRHCLAEGYPFVFGLQIYSPFEDVGDDGRVALPDPNEHDACGGHAMLCVGYSDADEVFVVRNSWGPEWGDEGYCYVPYEYLSNAQMAHDAWTLRRAHDLDFNQGAAGAEKPHGERASFFQDIDDTGDQEEADYQDDEDSESDSEEDNESESEEEDESDEDSEEGSEEDGESADEEDSESGEEEESELKKDLKKLEGELASLTERLKKKF